MSIVDETMNLVAKRDPNQPEFHQAVQEVVESLEPVLDRHRELRDAKIVERLVEPERIIQFRVPWIDDRGEVQVNRGFRVEFNSAIGPYKGGLRFHPTVNLSILKFLGFEQIFKNALTTLPIAVEMRVRLTEGQPTTICFVVLQHVPSYRPKYRCPRGDIGVGGREIGYMFGQYKRLTNRFEGVLTGKSVGWGGSLIRPEATGYGLVYFVQEMLKSRGNTLEGKTCLISGSGNVAQYAAEKVLALGGTVRTFSDSSGFIIDEAGIDNEKLAFVMDLKNNRRGRIREYAEAYSSATYIERDRAATSNPLWAVPADVALPCATQNEINGIDAQNLANNGCLAVGEGANMPSEPEAVSVFMDNQMLFGPAKAANAGGVAVSALEMSQNSMRMSWSRQEVDSKLHDIMVGIHDNASSAASEYGTPGNLVNGANIAGFLKVGRAMLDQGLV